MMHDDGGQWAREQQKEEEEEERHQNRTRHEHGASTTLDRMECMLYYSPGCDQQCAHQQHNECGSVVELESEVVYRNGLSSEFQLRRN